MDDDPASSPMAAVKDTTISTHHSAVAKIAKSITSFHARQVPFRVYHGATNSTQNRSVDPTRMIDTSQLRHVLHVDQSRKTCLVEPNVPMDQLVDDLAPYGLLPPVVMEFPGITVGGGFSGTAGESSGFKEGFFENTIIWIEIILPDGQRVHASPSQRADLFYGAAGTFGTLGIVTLLEMRLVDAAPYVELTYHPTGAVDDSLAILKRATQDPKNDYVDGIVLSPTRGVVVTGRRTQSVPAGTRLQTFARARDPWFYVHADRVTQKTKPNEPPVTECTPTRDYLFRYDRGAFWTGRYAFTYFLTPFNRVTRWALDYFLHTRVMYHALHASGHARKYMIQDLLLPERTAGQFVKFVEAEFGLWPLWLCPFTTAREISLHPRLEQTGADAAGGETTTSFVNIGVWGPGSTHYPTFVSQNRKLENKVRSLGGIKWLYAQTYYTADEFAEIYDGEWYAALREKYNATYLPTVYEKVRVKFTGGGDVSGEAVAGPGWGAWVKGKLWDVWPISGLYGVWATLPFARRGEYLLKNYGKEGGKKE